MKAIKNARAIGGLLSIVALLTLLVSHVVFPSVEVPMWIVALLLSLIGALLGIDIASEQWTNVNIKFGEDK